MDLGIRQIRTAGKGSGSIELTLPAELRDLVGLPCRILLSDGSRPDIVLQPDLQRARVAFAGVWRATATALLRDDSEVAALPLAAFSFGLHPRHAGSERPFLSWRDGLALAALPPHEPAAVARTLAAFGHALAGRLQIAPALAAGFGAACGALVTGWPAGADGQEPADLAANALRMSAPENGVDDAHATPPQAGACAAGVMSDAFWRHAAPTLAAAAELFLSWTDDPSGYAALRAAWRRGRAIEMSGG